MTWDEIVEICREGGWEMVPIAFTIRVIEKRVIVDRMVDGVRIDTLQPFFDVRLDETNVAWKCLCSIREEFGLALNIDRMFDYRFMWDGDPDLMTEILREELKALKVWKGVCAQKAWMSYLMFT